MRWLAKAAKVVSLDDILKGPNGLGLEVAMTFDDGYACLLDVVYPILREVGMMATVYVNTAMIGRGRRLISRTDWGYYPEEHFLSWEELDQLAKAGWSVGSHGVDHVDLTRVSGEEVSRQTTQSKSAIERFLGVSCVHFAYAWGQHNDAVRQRVSKAGYMFAASSIHAPIARPFNALAFPRLNVTTEYSLQDFKDIVIGLWDYVGEVQQMKAKLRSVLKRNV
jgi:peptidoglycan/xylan/chitin deacetylase (PgdA/CDA1 family)